MIGTRTYPREGFSVRWVTDVPVRNEEAFFEEGKEHYRYFQTLEEAQAFAREVIEQDFFGSVEIDEFTTERDEEYDIEDTVSVNHWILDGATFDKY